MKPQKKIEPRKPAAANAGESTPQSKSARPHARRVAQAPIGDRREPVVSPKTPTLSEAKTPKTSPASARPGGGKPAPKVPPLLLEGDEPIPAPKSGPGQRYALGPTPPREHVGAAGEAGELPEAYGTRKLLLAARDPHWLYAHWDLTREQLREFNRASADGHLVLRVYLETVAGTPFSEVHVHPESKNWFIHVGRGGTKFVVELGYHARTDGRWTRISVSTPTLTPPDALSSDTTVHFATIPLEVPFEQLLGVVKSALSENVPLAEAILQLRAAGHPGLPGPKEIEAGQWTPAQERALAQLISMDLIRRVWIGSLEVTELVRRQLAAELASAAAAQFSLPAEQRQVGALGSVSSPFGGPERKKGFWFNVNAELVVYGATEPDATVTIGERSVKLRPDGSFSFRFALPDGEYDLPIAVVSTDQTDGRAAKLKFSRQTTYRGEVGVHRQDSRLRPPRVEHVGQP